MKKSNDIERNIGICMRVGVILAAAIMLFGFALLLLNINQFASFDSFTIKEIIFGLSSLNPYSYLSLGIFVLILTPIIRVVASIILFIKEKNVLYSLITTAVLLILVLSFFVALIIG